MEWANTERRASPGPISASIQPFDNLFDAERAGAAVTEKIELENEPYSFGFNRIDVKFLLDGSDDVFCVLLGLIFVEERNDLSHHCVDRFRLVAHGLSAGNDPDAVLGKLAQVEFLLESFAEETAITVDDDKIEGMVTIAGAFDHLLEGGPAIVSSGCSWFQEFRDYLVALPAAP